MVTLDERMRDRWVLRILAALAALLLTAAGIEFLPWWPLIFYEKYFYLSNPGVIPTNWIWPGGIHSGRPLAEFSFLFLIAADLVIWWVVAYFLVLTPAYRILVRIRS